MYSFIYVYHSIHTFVCNNYNRNMDKGTVDKNSDKSHFDELNLLKMKDT